MRECLTVCRFWSLPRPWPVLGCLLILGVGDVAVRAETAGEAPAMRPRLSRTDGPSNVVYGLFDAQSGERVARLKIGRVLLDYGKQGMFRVAWKPRVLLQGVELDILDTTAWPAASGQLAGILDDLAGRGVVMMRAVRIRGLPGQAAEVTAASADYRTHQALQLHEVALGGQGSAGAWLALSGPEAGSLLSHQSKELTPPP